MPRRTAAVVFWLTLAAACQAAGPLKDGNWLLSTVTATGERATCILKVEGSSAAVVFAEPDLQVEIKDFKANDKEVSFTIRQSRNVQGRDISTEQRFVGAAGSDARQILGTLGGAMRAKLASTDKQSLAANELNVRLPVPEPFQRAQQLNARPGALQLQWQRETDPEKKRDLQRQMLEARNDANAKVPDLYREVLANHAEAPAALDAALFLLRMPQATLTAEDAGKAIKIIETHARPYGPQFLQSNLLQAAEALVGPKNQQAVALAVIEPLAKGLTDADPAAHQARVLTVYKSALEKSDRAADLAAVGERLARLESKLDEEYLATVPPFKPAAYAGRAAKDANRVAVMELFTGSQCPPCVAADVAFDALGKTYKPTDLILIQYHVHIPGPDPMTNPDSIARWDYYREKFPQAIRGTPSTLFNGNPEAGGGGGMANAESKFKQYRGIIDPLLEASTPIQLSGVASRSGDKYEINVSVEGVKPGSDDLKLRIVLVEETVKYVGGNGLRFHHHVVRAFPGGPAGMPLKEGASKHVATADLASIRAGLNKYLDDFAAQRPGAFKSKPLDLKHLKVIAFVQNDQTREILQATTFDLDALKDAASR